MVVLPRSAQNERLDRAIQGALQGAGRSASVREIRRALSEGRIRVDGRVRAPGDRALGNESVALDAFISRQESRIHPDPCLLDQVQVIAEDADLLVLAKPTGMPTGPLRPEEAGTLLHAAVAHTPEIEQAGPPLEGGLLHRLDYGTSGVVLFAKHLEARAVLRADFSAHRIKKRYLALVENPIEGPSPQVMDGGIGRGPTADRVRVVASGEGLFARTQVTVHQSFESGHTWVEAETSTGRRHQIRAHLAEKGAPIVGDAIYGSASPSLDLNPRLWLHASELWLPDGRHFEAPVPPEMETGLRFLAAIARPA